MIPRDVIPLVKPEQDELDVSDQSHCSACFIFARFNFDKLQLILLLRHNRLAFLLELHVNLCFIFFTHTGPRRGVARNNLSSR